MSWPPRPALAVLAVALALAPPSAASADVGTTIVERCIKHQSISGYSVADYHCALSEMSALVSQYTPCPELISQAELALAGLGAGPATGPGRQAIVPTLAESRAIEQAARSGSPPVRLGDRVLLPGVVHANIASAVSKLPDSLRAMLVFLLVALATVAARAIGRRIARSRRVS